MNIREEFERIAIQKYSWELTRSPHGYYMHKHVEYAFIGFCMARGIDHAKVP